MPSPDALVSPVPLPALHGPAGEFPSLEASICFSCVLNVKRDPLPLSCRGGLSDLSFCPTGRFPSLTDKQREHHKGTLPGTGAETGQRAEAGSPGSKPECGVVGAPDGPRPCCIPCRWVHEAPWSLGPAVPRCPGRGGVLSLTRTLGSPGSF